MEHIEQTNQLNDKKNPLYQICLQGHLSKQLSDSFQAFSINLTINLTGEGETVLSGPIRDQAELYGVLKKVRDMGIPLLSLNILETKEESYHE